jgi:hypothetical protein
MWAVAVVAAARVAVVAAARVALVATVSSEAAFSCLQERSVFEAVSDSLLEVVEGRVKAKVMHKNGQQESMLWKNENFCPNFRRWTFYCSRLF